MTTHDSDHDFRQFRHFDRPVNASPATDAALRRRLDAAATSVNATPATPSAPALPAVTSGAALLPGRKRPSPVSRPWQLAAAILAAIVVVSSLVIFRQPDEPVRLLYQPDTPVTSADVNAAGTAGRTWHVGDQNPIAGSAVTTNVSLNPTTGLTPLIAHGSLFRGEAKHTPEKSEVLVARWDLESGELLWAQPIPLLGVMASNDTHVFALRAEYMVGVESSQLVAIDINTGEITWEGPILANRGINPGSVVVDGDTVFALDFLGNVVAVDSSTGAIRWQYPEQFRAPIGSEDGNSAGVFLTPTLAASGDALFIVRPSQSVVKIDRTTGQESGVINVVDEYASATLRTDLAISDSYLLVMASNPSEFQASPSLFYRISPTELLVFDLKSLELVGRTTVNDVRGNIAIQGDTAFIPMADGDAISRTGNGWNPRSRIDVIDLPNLAVTSQIMGFEGSRQLLLSLAGDTLLVASAPGRIGFYDATTMELIDEVTIGLPPSEFDVQSPVVTDGTTPIVVGSVGEIYLLNGPSTPATPSAATPATD